MIPRFFSNKYIWLTMLFLLIAPTVHSELVNVGPKDRLYENLLFDGFIKSNSGDILLNILSGENWKASTNVGTDWKISPNNSSWQPAKVINYDFGQDSIYGKPEKIIPDRDSRNTITSEPTAAKFIWAPDSAGAADGRNGPLKAYFNYTFNLDDSLFKDGKILTGTTAYAQVLADDFFALSVNGHFLANGLLDTQIANNPAKNGLGRPVDVGFVDRLQPGQNTISIFAYDGYKIDEKDLIKKDSVSVDKKDGKLTASFTPLVQNITISDAADILGYDHFNWYQLGRLKNEDGQYSKTQFINCNLSLQGDANPAIPCTDPPKSFSLPENTYWSNATADTEPFYWDEFESVTDQRSYLNHIFDKSFQLIDQPSGGSKDFHFDTFLVGVRGKELSAPDTSWNPLYHLEWDKSSTGDITYSQDDYVIDKSKIDINIQECMNGDGAKQPSPDNRIYFYDQKSETCFRTQYVSEPPEWLLISIGFYSLILFKKKHPKI